MALRDQPIATQSQVPTASATVGPFFPAHFIGATDHDLTRRHPQGAQAQGHMIYVTGRVFEAARVPRWNTIIELCQADAQGIYAHPADPRHAQADPHFMGWGRCATDQIGAFSFLTVMPSGYVDPLTQAKRAPHLELSVSGSGLMRRLRTTLFFADLVDNTHDPVWTVVPPARRDALLLRAVAPIAQIPCWSIDLVLQGESETPFFVD